MEDAVEQQGHDGWMLENLGDGAARAHEWVEWAGEHVDEREAQLTALAEAEPLYFWALEYAIDQKPKWVLRKYVYAQGRVAPSRLGTHARREQSNLRVDEPLPLYRAFKPFVGDASAAAARFGNPYLRANKNWVKRRRMALEAQLAARGAAHLCTGNAARRRRTTRKRSRAARRRLSPRIRPTASTRARQPTGWVAGVVSTVS